MSVEAAKPVEETPVADTTKPLPEQPEASTAPAETSGEGTGAAPAPTEEPSAPATEDAKKDETAADTVPASEGILSYKEPTGLKKFFSLPSKHFFWFSEEPLTAESLTTFLRSDEKADTKHSTSAWARETGKGLLFFSKRAEDKATPAGVINLADASNIIREGFQQFSFKAGNHHHRFEASKTEERDSWMLAIEKAVEEAKSIKEEITGRESYKKNVEEYSKPAAVAAAGVKTSRSKSKEPKKSLDATAATTPAVDNTSTPVNGADEVTKANKERSQSRKRGSIFGRLGGKKDEHDEKKEEKAEPKEEKKEEKEEAKAAEEPSKAVEAAEASADAATGVPAAVTASDKKEEKEDASPTEKKAKRGSVFGFFKNRIGSPTTEKSEKEAMATKDSDVPPVSETAPKIEEPIENKPIDTAAVTAPVDTAETQAATSDEPAKEPTPAPATAETTTPKTEKKGIMSFIKKTEAKLEGKKEQKEDAKEEAAEPAAKDPAVAASTQPAATEGTEAAPAAAEERPARDNKRRTSLFFSKKKPEATSDAEDAAAEPKREKSPIPGGKFIGQLVRRASKAVKSEGSKEKAAPEPAATESAATAPAPAAVPEASEPTESKIVGDVVPENLHTATEPVTSATSEVKATT